MAINNFSMAVVVVSLLAIPSGALAAGPIKIVAAENFYGDVARQIGGPEVRVTSILSNPDADPHLFEVSPSAARAVSNARIAIYNGIGYDPWMGRLLSAEQSGDRISIAAARLVGQKAGDNPHIWYDPAAMMTVAKTLAEELSAADPAHRDGYRERLARFERSMHPIEKKIAALRRRLAGVSVTATEPVFGYMFAALGMKVRNRSFQISVMNNTEPSASDIAAFEDDLKARRVKLLVYNSQATNPVANRMIKLAKASHIPVVGATETEPPGKSYQAWMASELDAVAHALPN